MTKNEQKLVEILKNKDKAYQEIGFEMLKSQNLECKEFFDQLNVVYELKWGHKTKYKEDLIKFYHNDMLYLINKGIKQLPDEIGLFINVKWMDIRKNQITHLPSSMKNLTNLEVIFIGQMKIDNLDEIREQLPKITFER